VLKEAEAGVRTASLVRQHVLSEAKINTWRAKYGGMEVSKAKQLRSLEDKNDKLNRKAAKPADCRRILCWTTPR
jgi:putative transposase